MKEFYTIGEISKLFQVSPDTLRFYDKIDLLSPWKVGENGYRYYSKAQFEIISTILLLRNIGTPIEKLKVILNNSDGTLLYNALKEYRLQIDEKIEALKKQQEHILAYENSICDIGRSTEVYEKTLPDFHAILRECDYDRDELDSDMIYRLNHSDISDWISFASIVSTISKEDMVAGNYHTYKTYGYISESPVYGAPEELYRKIPAKRYVISDMVVDDVQHSTADRAYDRVMNYIREKNLEIDGDTIERNMFDLYRGSSEELTLYFRIYVPIK